MAKSKKQPAKWHVYQYPGNIQVMSDTQWSKLDGSQRSAYTLVKGGFDTEDEAMKAASDLRGKGRSAGG